MCMCMSVCVCMYVIISCITKTFSVRWRGCRSGVTDLTRVLPVRCTNTPRIFFYLALGPVLPFARQFSSYFAYTHTINQSMCSPRGTLKQTRMWHDSNQCPSTAGGIKRYPYHHRINRSTSLILLCKLLISCWPVRAAHIFFS